jgi:hypothetical protein
MMTLPRGPFRTVAAGVELMAVDTSVMASFQDKIDFRVTLKIRQNLS